MEQDRNGIEIPVSILELAGLLMSADSSLLCLSMFAGWANADDRSRWRDEVAARTTLRRLAFMDTGRALDRVACMRPLAAPERCLICSVAKFNVVPEFSFKLGLAGWSV